MFIAHLGPEAEGLPEGADMRIDALPELDIDAAVDRVMAELGTQGRLIVPRATPE
jgi:hypothetical protein